MFVDGVPAETHDQHQTTAHAGSGEALKNDVLGGCRFIQAAAAGHHGHGKRLQKVAAAGAADEADKRMADKAEAVLPGGKAATCAPKMPVIA